MSAEQVGLWAGFILTLMTFSAIFGDNVLYRLAVYAFTGLTAGFVAVVTWDTVLWPWLTTTVLGSQNAGVRVFGVLPFVFGLLLLLKPVRQFDRLGSLVLALLVGVGAAVSVVGALTGTLLPLAAEAATASARTGPVAAAITLVGVVCTLFAFQYGGLPDRTGVVQPNLLFRALGVVGSGFVAVTMGTLYAAAILASLVVLADRVGFLGQRLTLIAAGVFGG